MSVPPHDAPDATLLTMAPSADTADGRPCVLIIFPGALGDLLCLIPALRALSRRHPDADLELMAPLELARFAIGRLGIVPPHSPGVVRCHSRGIVRCHSIDRREVSHLFIEGASDEARAFFGAFDHVYSFFAADDPFFKRSLAAITRVSPIFIPFRPRGVGHVAECYLRALGENGGHQLDSRIEVTDQDGEAALRELDQIGFARGRYLLILPGSGSPQKNWPAENFAQLAQRLAPQIPSLVVLGPAEPALVPSLKAHGLAVLTGLDLPQVAAIAHFARAFVGNDSGVSHLAAAAEARGLVIFGPTDPLRWRPLGKVEIIRREPLDRLTVEEAAARLVTLLTNGRNDG
jgi:heptosyltransferase-2